MGSLKRSYLTAEEKNFYMITFAYVQSMEGLRNLEGRITDEIWKDWDKRGMMTPTMQRSLKMAHTYLKKFIYEIYENLNDTERTRLGKQSQDFDYRLVDSYTVQKLLRDMNDKLKYAVIERDKFEPMLQDLASVRCVGCKCNYEKCHFYKMIDDMHVPYVSEEPNCPYACNLSDLSEENLKNIEHLKDVIHNRKSVVKEFNRKVEYDDISNKNSRVNNESSTSQCINKNKRTKGQSTNKKSTNKKNWKQKGQTSKKKK